MMDSRIQNMKVGDKFATQPRMITATDIETFCSISGMMAPGFLSDAYIKRDKYYQETGLKSRVVPGWLQASFSSGNLILSALLSDGIFQLGANNVNSIAPAYPYDELKTEIEIMSRKVTKDGERVVIVYKWQVKNQNDVVTAKGENTCMFKNK